MSDQPKENEQENITAQNDVEKNIEESDTKESSMSAGKVLSTARKKLGIELSDLAKDIRVPLNVLEAIEIDKIPKNLPETFIRGYIRSYAKKVNVEETIVLPQVETTAVITEGPKKMQSFSRRNKRKASEKRMGLVTSLIIIASVAAFIYWWLQDSEKSGFAPLAATVQTSKSSNTMPEINAPNVSTTEPNNIQNSEPAPQSPAEDSSTSTNIGATNEQELTTISLTPEQKAIVADNGEPDEAGFLKVEMKFENECWVEVYDVTGDRIAIGNKPSGYLMTLNAQGPLNIVLGNSVGVSIWVNGKPFDTSELPKNRVARFELEAM